MLAPSKGYPLRIPFFEFTIIKEKYECNMVGAILKRMSFTNEPKPNPIGTHCGPLKRAFICSRICQQIWCPGLGQKKKKFFVNLHF